MSEPMPVDTSNKSFATCHACGATNPGHAQFCYSCGATQSTLPPPNVIDATQAPVPTYSGVVFCLMSSMFMIAVAIFDICQWITQEGTLDKFVRPALIGLIATGLSFASRRMWARNVAPLISLETSTRNMRRITTTTTTIGILLICTAILLGWLIGISRKQLRALDVDLAKYAAIGENISQARNKAGDTIADYVRMYEMIEPDVVALQTCNSRLILELGDYDKEFPEYHAQTARSMENVTITQRRMALLTKEIAVAKRVKTMEPEEQRAVWLGELVPIAQEEDKLDKK